VRDSCHTTPDNKLEMAAAAARATSESNAGAGATVGGARFRCGAEPRVTFWEIAILMGRSAGVSSAGGGVKPVMSVKWRVPVGGLGFGVWGFGCGVHGAWGVGFGVWGLGFGVWGLGVVVPVLVASGNMAAAAGRGTAAAAAADGSTAVSSIVQVASPVKDGTSSSSWTSYPSANT
jgi:hypothetical protein